MTNKVYVGNLPYSAGEDDLQALFDPKSFGCDGSIKQIDVITDKFSGRSKGFGFVQYEDADTANAAVAKLNGMEYGGRQLRVNIAQERERTGGGSNRGGQGGGRRDDRGGRGDR